jgi:hypothetical protein
MVVGWKYGCSPCSVKFIAEKPEVVQTASSAKLTEFPKDCYNVKMVDLSMMITVIVFCTHKTSENLLKLN